MTIQRRSVLRNLTLAATAGAAGPLLSACSSGSSGNPDARSSTPPPSTAPPTVKATTKAPPSASPSPALPANLPNQVQHGPRNRPMVALTFHGQGDPTLADSVLTAAERAGAHVTVLAVGSWLDAYPSMAHRVLSGGHDLGNHTQHHVNISSMTAAEVYQEIDTCARRLHKLTGSIGTWFRPSQAAMATPLVLQQARKAGYRHCLSYDVDSLDYTDPGPAAVRKTVLAQARAGSVVSMHLGHPGTLTALPGIIDGLRQAGLRAVTATEMLSS